MTDVTVTKATVDAGDAARLERWIAAEEPFLEQPFIVPLNRTRKPQKATVDGVHTAHL